MKLKMIQLIGIFTLAVSMLGMSSCQNDNSPAGTDTKYESIVQTEYSVCEPDALLGTIQDAAIDTEMLLMVPDIKPEPGKMMPPKGIRDLGRIFVKLNLTVEQKESIRNLMTAHRDCEKSALIALRDAEMAIIRPANEARKAIIQNVKDSLITKEEARAAIQLLNQQTRQALQDSQARQIAFSALKDCRDTLIENIKALLTPEQLLIWNKFYK